MKLWLIICIFSITLWGCSNQVEIPEDRYGLLLRFGKVENVVSGPIVINKPMFTTILLMSKSNEMLVLHGLFLLRYEITDPKEYYINFGTGQAHLQNVIEKAIANNSKKTNNMPELIKRNNLPIVIKMYCRMPCT